MRLLNNDTWPTTYILGVSLGIVAAIFSCNNDKKSNPTLKPVVVTQTCRAEFVRYGDFTMRVGQTGQLVVIKVDTLPGCNIRFHIRLDKDAP